MKTGGEARACLVGAEAIHILTRWDKEKENKGKISLSGYYEVMRLKGWKRE